MGPPHWYMIAIISQHESSFVAEDELVAIGQITFGAILFKWRGRRVGVNTSTRNEHLDSVCPSTKHLGMVWTDTRSRFVEATFVRTVGNQLAL
ncbi:hypothetical protein TNCV_3453291 [Trichonephila clavipes]|nr:hypothetical protein TNCV_3453291 [Trichonephila clavipes]